MQNRQTSTMQANTMRWTVLENSPETCIVHAVCICACTHVCMHCAHRNLESATFDRRLKNTNATLLIHAHTLHDTRTHSHNRVIARICWAPGHIAPLGHLHAQHCVCGCVYICGCVYVIFMGTFGRSDPCRTFQNRDNPPVASHVAVRVASQAAVRVASQAAPHNMPHNKARCIPQQHDDSWTREV